MPVRVADIRADGRFALDGITGEQANYSGFELELMKID
jgi:hypothetical protein